MLSLGPGSGRRNIVRKPAVLFSSTPASSSQQAEGNSFGVLASPSQGGPLEADEGEPEGEGSNEEDRVGDTYLKSRNTHARKDTSPARRSKISGRERSPRQ